jgi:hypothetical protein
LGRGQGEEGVVRLIIKQMIMKRINACLKMSAVVVLVLGCQCGLVHAQEYWPEKPGHPKKPVRPEMSGHPKKALPPGISVGPKKEWFEKDRMVTVTIPESTLREVMALMVERGYTLQEEGDYAVAAMKRDYMVAPKKGDYVVAAKKGDYVVAPKKDYAVTLKDDYAVAPKKRFENRPYIKSVPAVHKIAIKRHFYDWPDPSLEEAKEVVRHIIKDLVKEKIIAGEDSLVWFGLDNGQFVVNGKSMPDSLHALFRSRYVKPDGPGYYYGPVQVHGRGIFLDRKNIYGEGEKSYQYEKAGDDW